MATHSTRVCVSSYGRVVNGSGSVAPVEVDLARVRRSGARVDELVIDPLSDGWGPSEDPDHFRTGAAAALTVEAARERIENGDADAVLIRGDDALRTLYPRELRHRLMQVYDGVSIPEAYTELARRYIERRGWTETEFCDFADELWQNHVRRARRLGISLPPESRLAMLTPLFRFVDCANPVVDFSGRLLLVAGHLRPKTSIEVVGVGCGALDRDGPEAVSEIVRFEHLRQSWEAALADFGTDRFVAEFREGTALLELYTCYPVIPLAALLELGIVDDELDLVELLRARSVTVTAGMNLGRAPWANAAFSGLIAMCEELETKPSPVGLVHANGGLGYSQGWVLLQDTNDVTSLFSRSNAERR